MQTNEQQTATLPGAAFQERFVEADGFRIRYLEAGQGEPLVWLHGRGGLRVSRAHDLLAERHHVILFEAPGFGQSPANERSASLAELANTLVNAAVALGHERFDLVGHSFGGRLALWAAVQQPERIQSLVLAAPAAIPPEGGPRTTIAAESQANLLYAHPERQPAMPPPDPAVVAKQDALVKRLNPPGRDTALEERFGAATMPMLVLFGTDDLMTPPELGRIYRERLPNCNFILVYDAGHALDADRPEAFVSVVNDFLERHDSFLVNRDNALLNP